MAEKKLNSIEQLTFDDKNFNKGSEYGSSLIKKSIEKFGTGRSILIDKNNRIIAGNKTVESAADNGITKLKVVESDGTEVIAVKRTDIDLDSPMGRELALADNMTAKHNIVMDAEMISVEIEEAVMHDWGVSPKPELDYGLLDEDDMEDELNNLARGVKKAIQIEFQEGDYELAAELIRFFRKKEAYIGGMLIKKLQEEKKLAE